MSDLHVELAPFVPPSDGFDVVVLAGDVHNGAQALRWSRDAFPHHPIVQIAGNHEFWFDVHQRRLDAFREEARRLEIAFLENDAAHVAGVDFLGATLWTDFGVFERPARPLRMSAAEAMLANDRLIMDYRRIEFDDPGGRRGFGAADAVALHQASRQWLAHRLAIRADAPVVVVSHYLPSWRSVSPAFLRSVTNAAFVSDADELVERADVWVHGHTHSSHRYAIGRCEVVCNPRGYRGRGRAPGEFENPEFDPELVIEVPLPPAVR